jgi:hypothetical protein
MSMRMFIPAIPADVFHWVQFTSVLVVVLGCLSLACAQATHNNVDRGGAAAERGASVDLSSQPQTNPQEGASVPPPPRPRSGVSEEEYKARKERAAKGSSEPTETASPPRNPGR